MKRRCKRSASLFGQACEIADYVRHIRYEQSGTFLLHVPTATDAPSNQFTIQYSCPHTHTHSVLVSNRTQAASEDSWEEGHTSAGKNAEHAGSTRQNVPFLASKAF